jgi:hypothetical protein
MKEKQIEVLLIKFEVSGTKINKKRGKKKKSSISNQRLVGHVHHIVIKEHQYDPNMHHLRSYYLTIEYRLTRLLKAVEITHMACVNYLLFFNNNNIYLLKYQTIFQLP